MARVAPGQRLSKNGPVEGGVDCTPGETGYKHFAREESTGGSRSRGYDIHNRQARAS
jgi:hypothetical protein